MDSIDSTISEKKLLQLESKAKDIRKDIIKMITNAGSGHPAGSLGMADILTTLYFYSLKHDPKKPNWKNRDRLILSNGHICPVRYATMAHAGYFSKNELSTLRKFESRLQGHPEITHLKSLENTSGPLGDGVGQSIGIAYAAKMNKNNWYTYCLMSDGELQSGLVWESALFASKNKLDNLTWIIDRNNIQIDGRTGNIMPIDPLDEKFESFGFEVIEIDGHNIREIINAINLSKTIAEKPVVIIAHTIPGKGVDFMEKNYKWHGAIPGKGPDDIVAKSKQVTKALESINK